MSSYIISRALAARAIRVKMDMTLFVMAGLVPAIHDFDLSIF
jgi:hypothetical protein